jgi:hypothetical protein
MERSSEPPRHDNQRESHVNSTRRTVPYALAVLGCAAIVAPIVATPAVAAQPIPLISHRGVYDLKLSESRKTAVQAVRGRILYDFGGSACDGYTTQIRQVTEMDGGERGPSLSDLRSTTWEDEAGQSFRFASTNFVNQRKASDVEGTAKRGADGIEVVLKKPAEKTLRLPAATTFPTDHLRRVIVAAREGKKILQLPVYDGSEDGEKVYNTLTVIGDPIPPSKQPSDAAAGKSELTTATRWHVRVSYFDQAGGGEQTPVYSIAFELYDNGVSRALTLDYNDFEITGVMSALDIRGTPACK